VEKKNLRRIAEKGLALKERFLVPAIAEEASYQVPGSGKKTKEKSSVVGGRKLEGFSLRFRRTHNDWIDCRGLGDDLTLRWAKGTGDFQAPMAAGSRGLPILFRGEKKKDL